MEDIDPTDPDNAPTDAEMDQKLKDGIATAEARLSETESAAESLTKGAIQIQESQQRAADVDLEYRRALLTHMADEREERADERASTRSSAHVNALEQVKRDAAYARECAAIATERLNIANRYTNSMEQFAKHHGEQLEVNERIAVSLDRIADSLQAISTRPAHG